MSFSLKDKIRKKMQAQIRKQCELYKIRHQGYKSVSTYEIFLLGCHYREVTQREPFISVKIDKQAEEERKKRQEEEQRSREDELRELSDRLRKRERDKRRPDGGSANRSASPPSGNSDDGGGEGARRKS